MSSAHNSCSVDDGEEGVDSTDGATATAGDTTSGLLKIQSDFDLMSLDPKDKKVSSLVGCFTLGISARAVRRVFAHTLRHRVLSAARGHSRKMATVDFRH